jgi:hypothetical protein
MKNLKFPLIALLTAGLLTIAFIGCKKDSLTPSLTSAAKGGGGGGTTPPPAFIFNAPTFGTACVTDASYCFDASFTTKGLTDPGGNNSITVSISQAGAPVYDVNGNLVTDQVVQGTSGTFCFSNLAAGQYTVLVYFRHNGSDNAQPVNVPLTFTLTVQTADVCSASSCTADGVSLTRSVSNVETDVNGIVTSLQANYIVTNCGGANLTNLKLQGGLINKSSIIGTPSPVSGPTDANGGGATNIKYKLSTTAASNVLTWTFDLPAGTTQTFSVYYSVWGVSCGSPLTGAWSLKNSAGTPIGVSPSDMSAEQAGYLDRLIWNCQ